MSTSPYEERSGLPKIRQLLDSADRAVVLRSSPLHVAVQEAPI